MFNLAMVIYYNCATSQNRVISLVIEKSLIIYQLFTWMKSKVVSWIAGILFSFSPAYSRALGLLYLSSTLAVTVKTLFHPIFLSVL